MIFDILNPIRTIAQTLGRVLNEQLLQNILGDGGENGEHSDLIVSNHLQLLHLCLISYLERVDPREHFVYYQPKCPEVNFLAIALPTNDFRRQVLGRAAESEGDLSVALPDLAQAEVC